MNHGFSVTLDKILYGRPFMMVNYSGVFIRVFGDPKSMTFERHRGSNPLPFNDDGSHVPIVELATGKLSWMSKEKPCLVYPGESTAPLDGPRRL